MLKCCVAPPLLFCVINKKPVTSANLVFSFAYNGISNIGPLTNRIQVGFYNILTECHISIIIANSVVYSKNLYGSSREKSVTTWNFLMWKKPMQVCSPIPRNQFLLLKGQFHRCLLVYSIWRALLLPIQY